jgi:hypothetical protein
MTITVNYWGLTGTLSSVSIDETTATIDDLITEIAADEGLPTVYYAISLLNDPSINDVVFGDSATTLDDPSMDIQNGDTFLCTTNQYGTKEERQIQKLEIASIKRGESYDITKLPTRYVGNTVVDNPNTGGLVNHRPWNIDPTIVTRNLQLFLDPSDVDSYPGNGASYYDLSTNEYTTTLEGAPAYNSTHFTFDGTAQYVDTNQSLALETFSIGCWFRTSAAGIKMIISKESTAGNPWNYRLWLNSGQLIFDMSQVTTQSSLTSPLTNYNNGAWYYVIATRNDSNWYLYVNGTQVNTKADPYTGSVTNAQELWIGRSAFTGAPNGYQYPGDIGQVFIYNDALTATEVLQNYNATKTIYGL